MTLSLAKILATYTPLKILEWWPNGGRCVLRSRFVRLQKARSCTPTRAEGQRDTFRAAASVYCNYILLNRVDWGLINALNENSPKSWSITAKLFTRAIQHKELTQPKTNPIIALSTGYAVKLARTCTLQFVQHAFALFNAPLNEQRVKPLRMQL